MARAWFVAAVVAAGCGGGGATRGPGEPWSDAAVPGDAGATDAGSSASPIEGQDAGNSPGDSRTDAGDASDAGGGLLDPILEYTTCEPDEINPIVECATVTCPMQPDPLSLVNCLLAMCAPLVDEVNQKCKDCVTAAVAQDVAGLLSSCLKTEPAPGTPGATN